MIDYSEIHCEFMTKDQIDEQADDFYNQHWGNNNLPVDIELIIEKLGLEIIPIENLENIDAYLSINNNSIFVKYKIYIDERYENRLRFSFAHEIGHLILHKNIISKMTFNTAEEYYEFITNFPENEYGFFEYQANEFAGRLLVPYNRLVEEVDNVNNLIIQHNKQELLQKDPDQMLEIVSPTLCKPFGVSEDVIKKRVDRENLWPPKINK